MLAYGATDLVRPSRPIPCRLCAARRKRDTLVHEPFVDGGHLVLLSVLVAVAAVAQRLEVFGDVERAPRRVAAVMDLARRRPAAVAAPARPFHRLAADGAKARVAQVLGVGAVAHAASSPRSRTA